jgi:2-(1,2-epoxy-1,2-dihydrophenyl)acetyl-CoA isomerase
MESMQDCQKPVIVALNGTAAGGGTMLVLAADLVIAADNARFVDVFTSNALIPDGGFAYLLPHIVGMHKAKELVFFGDTLSAAELADLGIVNKVVPAAELEAEARAWATRLAAKPTKVVGWAKKLLHDAVSLPRTAVLEEEAGFIELNLGTEDGKERIAAMMERRDPEWKGW